MTQRCLSVNENVLLKVRKKEKIVLKIGEIIEIIICLVPFHLFRA